MLGYVDPDRVVASMRPRVFPAEDPERPCRWTTGCRSFNEAAGIPRGRPWRRTCSALSTNRFNEAAGIPRGRRGHHRGPRRPDGTASMRPRVFPAEDGEVVVHELDLAVASMRPRVFPAEDAPCMAAGPGSSPRFNEAAGIPRGRRLIGAVKRVLSPASMRPRVFPAEDVASGYPCRCLAPRFNEAAGIPRGRLDHIQHEPSANSELQ